MFVPSQNGVCLGRNIVAPKVEIVVNDVVRAEL